MMRLTNTQALIMILIIGAVTMVYKTLPFLIFRKTSALPKPIMAMGEVMPYAMMALLVVYSLRHTKFLTWPYGLPEVIASATVVILHLWKKKQILSILVGTVVYMLLIQVVF